jgi:DNA-binding MarR family transcriptional regulator
MAQPKADCSDGSPQAINYSYLPDLVGHLLGLAHLRVTQLCTEVMEPLQLTPKQFVALEFISNNPCTSQKRIAEHIGTAPAVMVGILDALAKRGLTQRVRAKHDRRKHFVQLTPDGEDMLAEIRRLAFEVERQYAEETGLTPSEREIILTILRKMTNRQPASIMRSQ